MAFKRSGVRFSYAPLKSASHTREGPIAFPECLHSAYILAFSENRTVDGPGAVLVRFAWKKEKAQRRYRSGCRAQAFLKNGDWPHIQGQSYKLFRVPSLFAIFDVPTCNLNTL